MTTQELLSEWRGWLIKQGLAKNTVDAYEVAVSNLFDWYADQHNQSINPALVAPDELYRWRQDQLDKGVKHSTVNQRLSAVRQFFIWLQLVGVRLDNPAENVVSVSVAETSSDPLSDADEGRLVREARKRAEVRWGDFAIRDRAMILLMLRAGLRVSELLHLRVGDIELRDRSGSVKVNGSGGREIALELETREALGVYLDLVHPASQDPSEPLWYGHQGPVSSRSTINRMLSKYADFARLEDREITPQRLRDTYAKHFLENNPGDLQGLAAAMGIYGEGSANRYI